MALLHKTLLPMLLVCAALPAHAQEKAAPIDLTVRGGASVQYISEHKDDLGTNPARDDTQDSLSEQLYVSADLRTSEDLQFYFSGRALNIDGETGFTDDNDEDNDAAVDQGFLELRELYVLNRNLFGVTPWYLQAGRQRLREPRALWWNSDNDLIKVGYDSSLLKGFIAAGEDTTSWRTGRGTDYMRDDENRFRVMGETSWQYSYNHFLEGRVLYENDHSGTTATGGSVSATDMDREDQDMVWFGARLAGTTKNIPAALGSLKYRADLVGLTGEENIESSVASATPGVNTVTGNNKRDVNAWAFDGDITFVPPKMRGLALTAGYAFGSGDGSTTGDSSAFRQSDIQGSSSRVGLERQAQRHYGEVLRPELSNIHILSAGAGYPLSAATDIGLTYYYYHLDEEATGLRYSGITAPVNGRDGSLGHAADLALNVGLTDEFDLQTPYIDDIGFRFVVGGFTPGDAYEPTGNDNSYRLFTELKVRF